MKYKTLIRKSDGQWMVFHNEILVESETPDLWSEKYWKSILNFPIDWSLYDFIEVAVIRMDDVPSEEEIKRHYPISHVFAIPIIEWFKEQILKP